MYNSTGSYNYDNAISLDSANLVTCIFIKIFVGQPIDLVAKLLDL